MISYIKYVSTNFSKNRPTVVTVGKFDGVHLGHCALIKNLLQLANKHNLIPLVLLLEPHPYDYFKPSQQTRLMSLHTKISTLQGLGVQVAILPFNKIVDLSAQEFIQKILIDACQCKQIVVGENFMFGKKQQGDLSLLKEHKKDFRVNIAPILHSDNKIISSSVIRQLLQENNLTLANQLLGQKFTLTGKVVEGFKRGRQLGFPTANIYTKIKTPLAGVYYGLVNSNQQKHLPAVANIGFNPTFNNKYKSVEVHIINSNPNLYQQKISFTPLGFIRGEQKYNNLDALKTAIKADIATAEKHLQNIQNSD